MCVCVCVCVCVCHVVAFVSCHAMYVDLSVYTLCMHVYNIMYVRMVPSTSACTYVSDTANLCLYMNVYVSIITFIYPPTHLCTYVQI